jgi:endo-1,3-1,4-beta-glycanase ExoK
LEVLLMGKSQNSSKIRCLSLGIGVAIASAPAAAWAVSSSELYTTAAYQYGRFAARIQYASGDGVISSFFLWKDGSEKENVFWNELDFEKLRANCELETNALYGLPVAGHHLVYDPAVKQSATNLCGGFHTYVYEWTPDAIAWFIDGIEIRRETGEIAAAFRDNASQGMQIHFNIWPGDESFGGNFNPAVLPLHQFVNWVEYSSFSNGDFHLEWREDFDANAVPAGWTTGNWASPKNLSTHSAANVTFKNGYAVLSLTADNATGSAGVNPMDPGDEQTGENPTPDAGAGNENDAAVPSPTPSGTGSAGATAQPTATVPSSPPASTASAIATTGTATPAATPTATVPAVSQSAPMPAAPTASSAAPPAEAPGATNQVPSVSPSPIPATPNSSTSNSGCTLQATNHGTSTSLAWLGALFALAYTRTTRATRVNKH